MRNNTALGAEIKAHKEKNIIKDFTETLSSVEPIVATRHDVTPEGLTLMNQFNGLSPEDKKKVIKLMKEEKALLSAKAKEKADKAKKKLKKKGELK